MSSPLELLSALYDLMLRCYPPAVRDQFGEEMHAVFQETIHHQTANEPWGPLGSLLRELRDWPFLLLSAHLEALRGRLDQVDGATQARSGAGAYRAQEFAMASNDELSAFDRGQAVRMSLPPLALGLGVMLSALIRTDVWSRLPAWQLYLSLAVMLLAGALVGLIGLLVLWKGLPDSGVTWLASAFLGFTLFVQTLTGELVDEGRLTLSPGVEIALGLLFLAVGLALLAVFAYRSWAHAGLFTMAAAAAMGVSLLQAVTAAPFNRDDLALLAGPLGLAFALLLYLYIVQPGLPRLAVIAGTGLLNGGVVLLASNAWQSWLQNRGAPSPDVPLLVLITALLLSGPISGALMRPIRRL